MQKFKELMDQKYVIASTQHNEFFDARNAMKQAQLIVNQEIDGLHMDKRYKDDLIKSHQEQIRILREEAQEREIRHASEIYYTTRSESRAYRIADHSIIQMFVALVLAFIAIGYAVWVG